MTRHPTPKTMQEWNQRIGQRIREIMDCDDPPWSLQDLANELRVPKSTVAHWVDGSRGLDLLNATKVAGALGVSTTYLLLLDEEGDPI